MLKAFYPAINYFHLIEIDFSNLKTQISILTMESLMAQTESWKGNGCINPNPPYHWYAG